MTILLNQLTKYNGYPFPIRGQDNHLQEHEPKLWISYKQINQNT